MIFAISVLSIGRSMGRISTSKIWSLVSSSLSHVLNNRGQQGGKNGKVANVVYNHLLEISLHPLYSNGKSVKRNQKPQPKQKIIFHPLYSNGKSVKRNKKPQPKQK